MDVIEGDFRNIEDLMQIKKRVVPLKIVREYRDVDDMFKEDVEVLEVRMLTDNDVLITYAREAL